MIDPYDQEKNFVAVCVVYWSCQIQHRADVVLTMKLWIECNEKYLGRRIGAAGIDRMFPDRYELPYVGIETPPGMRMRFGDNLLNV